MLIIMASPVLVGSRADECGQGPTRDASCTQPRRPIGMHNNEGAGWGCQSVVRLSIPQGQQRVFAGNEQHVRLSPAPTTSPGKTPKPRYPRPLNYTPSRVVTAFLQVFPSGRGQESPDLCPVAVRPHSQQRARATSFGAIRRFVPSPVSVPAGEARAPSGSVPHPWFPGSE